MKDIDSAMNIKAKKYDPKRLELTLGAYGHTLEVISLNETHLTRFMSPEYVPGTLLNHMLRDSDEVTYSNLRHFSLDLPTSFGLLAYLDVMMPTVRYLKREKSSFGIDKSGAMKLKLNQHFLMESTLRESMGFDVPGFEAYLGIAFDKNIKIDAPLNIDVDWNFASGKLTFNEDVQLPRDLLHYSYVPYTMNGSSKKVVPNVKWNLFKDEELEKFDKVLPVGGAKIRIKGKTLPNDWFSTQYLLGWIFDHELNVKINELLCNPKWIPRQLVLSLEQPEKGILKGVR